MQALNFLTSLNQSGYTYNQINTACSVMGAILNIENKYMWGKLPIVKRFMKGVFEAKPVFPKNYFVWDVSKVFNLFRELEDPEMLDIKILSQKLCMLIILLSGGQRCQTIHSINIEDLKVVDNSLYIPIMEKVKQTKASKHMKPLKFMPYIKEPKLCVVTHLTQYLKLTTPRRQCSSLFISYIKPYKAVTRDTLRRWCKEIMKMSGINITKYSSHSSRSAATSLAKQKGMSMALICQFAGWSNEKTFARFYNKDIEENTCFQDKIM